MTRPGAGWRSIVCVAVVTVAGGCLGYRVGTTLPEDLRVIHLTPFVNRTGEPAIEVAATAAAADEFRRDGTVRMADAGSADALVQVTLAVHRLYPLRYRRDRSKTAREYRMELVADIQMTRVRTGDVLLKKRVVGDATFLVEGDLVSAKRGALPNATRDLAREMVESVVDYW